MWEVFAIAAAILVVSIIVLLQIIRFHRKNTLRAIENKYRPEYQVCSQTVHALADWESACRKSLEWSRRRRKEIK